MHAFGGSGGSSKRQAVAYSHHGWRKAAASTVLFLDLRATFNDDRRLSSVDLTMSFNLAQLSSRQWHH